ncbi:MAG: cupredoxin domain-containing protein [Casimicrobiaceae bacterium]
MHAGTLVRSITAAMAVAAAAAIPATAAEHTATMKGMNYQPALINAKVGDTVKFVNDDAADHEVFVPTKGFATDLGMQKPGASTELPLTKPGAFEVECVVHPHMLLKINVAK